MLLNMAETWESLAVTREKKLARDGSLKTDVGRDGCFAKDCGAWGTAATD
jgi:hypothetical protein